MFLKAFAGVSIEITIPAADDRLNDFNPLSFSSSSF